MDIFYSICCILLMVKRILKIMVSIFLILTACNWFFELIGMRYRYFDYAMPQTGFWGKWEQDLEIQ